MSINMLDIAKKLNISLMTVSRALNGKGYVKKETRKKILETAEELGYIQNALAKGLALNKTFNIGLVITDISNPFYSKITKVIQEEALKKGYHLTLFNTNENVEAEKEALYTIMEQRCDGALLTTASKDFNLVCDLKKKGLPIVLLNRRPNRDDLDFVVCDNKKGAFLATDYLLQLGHENIAHITGSTFISSVKEKIEGYEAAFNKKGLKMNKRLIYETELSLMGSYRTTLEMLKDNLNITAIFTYTDWMAIGVIKALNEKNIKIPDHISLIGYDNIEISPYLEIPLTTIDMPISLMGKKAIEILLERINANIEIDKVFNKIYKPALIERKSCKKL